MDYLSNKPYMAAEEPHPQKETAIFSTVPGYWEDMTTVLREGQLRHKLQWNPNYLAQRYPQTEYCPDMTLLNPVGCFVYQKEFALAEIPHGEIRLAFGGAQNVVSAWINGHYLGRHEGYSTPFSFAVPAESLRIGENRITLAVSNNRLQGYMGRPVSGLTSRAANECTGGIYGDVQLRVLADGLTDVWVTTAQDLSSFTVHTEGAKDHRRIVRIFDGAECVRTVEIAPGADSVMISACGFALWSPDCPKLYTAVVSTAGQEVTCRFGIRRLTVKDTALYLNDEPYYFRGICEHCYQLLTVHPTRDKQYYYRVIRTLKELGFNSIRFHTWIPPYEYMEAADELGMLMEVESPNNTSFAEWKEIVRFCRHYAAVNLYSTGNELQIDFDYENHLRACAELVHSKTDALFSPMSAMRGIEYMLRPEDLCESEPFLHNPERLARVGEYSDLYNSYSLGLTSYNSVEGRQEILDRRNAIYGKPLLSHEICIQGTYIDLSLEERYKGTRIGETEFMSSVRTHLADQGLLARADLYYRNSAAWQRILRKYCFETVRRCETFAGYDFLGDIDTHWHTFGYCVGMMNEFYELKAGETVENVLRYNGATVLLADLPDCVNYKAGAIAEIPVLISHYGKPIFGATLHICVRAEDKVLLEKTVRIDRVNAGEISELHSVCLTMPQCEKPMKLTLTASLSAIEAVCENTWQLYVFPETAAPAQEKMAGQNVVVLTDGSAAELTGLLEQGKTVVLFGAGPFATNEATFQLSIAGRTNGHLATVIAEHPLMMDFPHDGYCGMQFTQMMNNSVAAVLDGVTMPHDPILDIATSYKNAHREAMLFEYGVGSGKLLVCTLNLTEEDPAACWLKNRILDYAVSDDFCPAQVLTEQQLKTLFRVSSVKAAGNCNQAMNKNDITA